MSAKKNVKEDEESGDFNGWRTEETWMLYTNFSNEQDWARQISSMAKRCKSDDEFQFYVRDSILWKHGVEKIDDRNIALLMGSIVLTTMRRVHWPSLRKAMAAMEFS
jgi:hypothetical protein